MDAPYGRADVRGNRRPAAHTDAPAAQKRGGDHGLYPSFISIVGGVWLNLQVYTVQSYTGGAPWVAVRVAVLRALSLLVGAGWFAVQFYALPYLMEQDRLSLRQAYRNALLTVLASPLYTFFMLPFVLLLVLISVRFVVLLFLGVPPLIAVLGVHAVAERLRAYRARGGGA